MRFLLTLVCFALLQVLSAQNLSSSNKKALKKYEKAVEALQNREDENAIPYLKEAIEEDPGFIEPYIILGDIHSDLNKLKEAISYYDHVISIDADFYPEAYFKLAKNHFLLEQYKEALENVSIYLKEPNRKRRLDVFAQSILKNASFAAEAIKEPVAVEFKNLGVNINTQFNEYYPCLTADDQTLLFTRRVPDDRVMTRVKEQEDFFVSKRGKDGEWQKASGIGAIINTEFNEGAPTITSDGKLLVFTACELYGDLNYGDNRKGLGSCDLFYSINVGGEWTRPENLGGGVNSNLWESQPSLSADGRELYFVRGARSRTGAVAGMDIMVADRIGEYRYGNVRPLKDVINTPEDESSVLIHPDGKTLYFSSQGHPGFGGEDLFVSKRDAEGNWGKPLNLGYPINTVRNENSLLVSAKGDLAYFASDREGGQGGLDLYSFYLPDGTQAIPVAYVKGVVIDKVTKKPLKADFQLYDLETEELVVESKSDPKDGSFLLTLPVNKTYALNVSKDGYLFHSENFDVTSNNQNNPKDLPVALTPIKTGERIVLQNIFFETAMFNLKPESEVELTKLYEFLNANASLSVEIGGHTDNVGSDVDNQILSQNRAQAVYNYLVEKGISAERLAYKGYGETMPIQTNDTEEGRALNRRTEFMIL